MAGPSEVAQNKECKHSGDACQVEGILVWYMILPRDTQNVPEVLLVRGFEPALLAEIESPYNALPKSRGLST